MEKQMKKYYLLAIAATLLTGCLDSRQAKTQSKILQADKAANIKVKDYKANIREIKPYDPYRYDSQINDPFQIKEFLIEDEGNVVVSSTNEPLCEPPTCVPPIPHEKNFLENYSLDELAFVGTLSRDGKIGLVQTPDLGVMRVVKGDYIGRNNGRVLAIKETAIVLQEKIYKSGIWEDKKTVLMINK